MTCLGSGMLALPSVTEEESWVVSVNGGNGLHPAEPGLACTKPARSDSEAGGEMHHSEPGVGVSPGQQQWRQLLRRVTQGQLKGLEPGAVSDSGTQGGNGGRGE